MLEPADLRAVDAAIDRDAELSFDLLARLVQAPSVIGDEAGALEVLDTELLRLGFSTRRIEIPADIGDDPQAGVAQAVAGERYSLLGTLDGGPGPSLLLNGHIDVVPAGSPQLWTSEPFLARRADGRLYGRGAGDMKCGFAMGVLALGALRELAPQALTGSLSLLAAVEEECTGNGTLAAARQGVLADAVVLLEPTDLGIMLGGVGVLWCDVGLVGYATHAQLAHLSINPLDLAARLIDGLREWSATLQVEYPDSELGADSSLYNVNVGGLMAGDWPSSVPTDATVRLRIGFPRSWSATRAEAEVRVAVSLIAKQDGGFPVPPTLRLTGFRAEGYLLAPEHPLALAMSLAHQQAHGDAPVMFSLGSTTDARTYLNYFDTPALCYGPSAANIHGVDESVELASIVAGAKTLARFLVNWFAS